MSKLSGIRDLDREILGKLDDKEILTACSIDKYSWNTVCDDSFLRRRLLMKYPKIEKEKYEGETWKRFFLRAVNYISLLKERYGYDYTFGNFVTQYRIFKESHINDKNLLERAVCKGELALVVWSLKNGADIHFYNETALRSASEKGYLEIVKYLVENGADIHISDECPLKVASQDGHLEVVKYLVENGADIHAQGDCSLRLASKYGHMEVVKYLVETGANINACDDYSIRFASFRNHLDIVKYLIENGADINALK